jgi:lipopolysaccharide transport system permease protein
VSRAETVPGAVMARGTGLSPAVLSAKDPILDKVEVSTVKSQTGHSPVCPVLPVVVLFLLIYGMTPSWTWLYGVPILAILQLAITMGVSLAVATLNLFFRDMLRLTNIFVMMLFYVTPVLFSETMVPRRYRMLLSLNPLAPLMINWRSLLMKGALNQEYLAFSLVYGVLFLAAGYWIFNKLSWRFAEVV